MRLISWNLETIQQGADWNGEIEVEDAAPSPDTRAREALTSSERMLLEWLQKDDGQYGECHGATLDGLIAKGLAKVNGAETGIDNGFIAKGTGIMFRSVSITDAGRNALTALPQPGAVETSGIGHDWKLSDDTKRHIGEIENNIRNAAVNADRTIAGSPALDPASVEACAKIAKQMREKHGSPTGDAYSCGVWDQGVRIEQQIRALIGQPARNAEVVKP